MIINLSSDFALNNNIRLLLVKLPLVKKRWNILITCQQKMGHLSDTRVFTKSILDIIPKPIYCANCIGFGINWNILDAPPIETIEEVELAMNNDLLRIKEWLLANKLSLNVAKTEFLLIGSHHKLNNLDSQPSVNIGHDSIINSLTAHPKSFNR